MTTLYIYATKWAHSSLPYVSASFEPKTDKSSHILLETVEIKEIDYTHKELVNVFFEAKTVVNQARILELKAELKGLEYE